jgi:hypothetical protein
VRLYSYTGGYGGSNPVENGLTNLSFIINAAIARQQGSDAELSDAKCFVYQ